MKYSIIIPVYNRPQELQELLESLLEQTFQDFEVIIVEDGSTISSESVVHTFSQRLNIRYFVKENGGPGQARNYGVQHAAGIYLLILDSDVILPPGYLAAIDTALMDHPCDAFGGPDRAHLSFTPIQKAINYAMTSFFTTGGIRGGKQQMDRFYPRSFNMGVRRSVYTALHGFSDMRFGEDIDFSTRIIKAGYTSKLIPQAWVWHKRRANFRQFFKQVHNSGIARIHLSKLHPGTLKVVHLLPAAFTLGVLLLLIGTLWCPYAWLPLLLFALIILADALRQKASPRVAGLAVVAAAIQLIGYGTGFLRAWWVCVVLRRRHLEAFKHSFYK